MPHRRCYLHWDESSSLVCAAFATSLASSDPCGLEWSWRAIRRCSHKYHKICVDHWTEAVGKVWSTFCITVDHMKSFFYHFSCSLRRLLWNDRLTGWLTDRPLTVWPPKTLNNYNPLWWTSLISVNQHHLAPGDEVALPDFTVYVAFWFDSFILTYSHPMCSSLVSRALC